MATITEELNKASHVLLEAEIRLRTVTIQIQQLEKDIAILTAVEINLEENISVLKRKRAIVIVNEYKKATIDLNTARNRRAFLRIDRENCLKIERKAEILYEKARDEHERIFKLIHSTPNNLIRLDFRKKNGQK